jgi:hypothetical protein
MTEDLLDNFHYKPTKDEEWIVFKDHLIVFTPNNPPRCYVSKTFNTHKAKDEKTRQD